MARTFEAPVLGRPAHRAAEVRTAAIERDDALGVEPDRERHAPVGGDDVTRLADRESVETGRADLRGQVEGAVGVTAEPIADERHDGRGAGGAEKASPVEP